MVPELVKVQIPNVASFQGAFLPEPWRIVEKREKDTGLRIKRLVFKYHFGHLLAP